jgi:hypothetical protein
LFTEGIIASAAQVSAIAHRGEPVPETGLQNTVRVELCPDVTVDRQGFPRRITCYRTELSGPLHEYLCS